MTLAGPQHDAPLADPTPPDSGDSINDGLDPVGRADALRHDVAARIERSCTDLDSSNRTHEPRADADSTVATSNVRAEIYVGWVAALDVACCPARYRADGADGWGFPGWAPPLAAAAVGRAALARHLQLHAGAPAVPALPAPLELVRAWLRDAAKGPTSSVAEWVAELVRSDDRTSRTTVAATAAAATRWLAGFVRVLAWPLPNRLGIVTDDAEGPFARRWPKRWRPRRGSPISVASSPDAVVGRLTAAGDFDLVVHRTTSPVDDVVIDRAAFEATAAALTCGITPASVLVTTGDSAERCRLPVDDRLLARGADLVIEVVRQRLVAAQPDWDLTDGTPSAACRHCPHQQACPPGQAWLSSPVGRRRGGLPVVG